MSFFTHRIGTPMKAPIIFVTGTDTDVGKTFVSSLLAIKWKASYWKPIQTGIEEDEGDTTTVKKICNSLGYQIESAKPAFEMQKPLSPLEAMNFEPEVNIKLSDFKIPSAYASDRPLIMEGAGGVCVPITKQLQTTVDLIKNFLDTVDRPFRIVIVGRSGLGTLNHTLLTVEHLKVAGLENFILGCVLSGKKNAGNAETLKKYGINIIAQVDQCNNPEDMATALSEIPFFNQLK